MIVGAHTIIYSKDAEADRAFLRDVLRLPNVDVGEGWLIFGLPPAEVAIHDGDQNEVHEFYFMVDDVRALIAAMEKHGAACEPAQDMGWGVLTQVMLPGGGKLGFYEPRHARPQQVAAQAKVSKVKAKVKVSKVKAKVKVSKVKAKVKASKPAARKKARPAAKRGSMARRKKVSKKRRTARR